MGQYYKIVNIDKKQFLNPHRFGDGLKLLEFGSSGGGTMNGLAVLLANSNNRGGGDLRSDHEIVGSWAGDRIVIAGDYAVPTDKGENSRVKGADGKFANLYYRCDTDEFEDISEQVLIAMCDDPYLKQDIANSLKQGTFGMGDDASPLLYAAAGVPVPADVS